MNKNAIQKYAIWARNELITQIKQRAYQYGVRENNYDECHNVVIAGRVLTDAEKRQQSDFVKLVARVGYEQAIEEVAYTWFNRFVALRYMEVNDYLPTHIRVFSDANGAFNPEILKDVLHLELPGLDKSKISEFINANATDDLYRYLLLTQCNALNEALPEMFERMGGYSEILLPNNILRQDGILERLVNWIPEEDWKTVDGESKNDAVEIVGWMYQYYNTEPKQAVFDGLKKNQKITKEKIPAATQLFTPRWIVRYMVENSLGRLWLEGHPDNNLLKSWKYYLPDAEQTPEVEAELDKIRRTTQNIKPEDIKVIDPCMGSGHILVYAFDVLIQVYRTVGYSDRDAAKLILEKNLYGLDIDRRAYQLAYFSLMMKARQYNRRIFMQGVEPQVYHPTRWVDGEEYGSLVEVDKLKSIPEYENFRITSGFNNYEEQLRVWNFKRLLSQKYDVVVTNPPYMAPAPFQADWVRKKYPDSKSDLFAVFIEKCGKLMKPMGYQAMITQHSWMFLSSYEKLRVKLKQRDIVNMAHLGSRAFSEISGEVVQTTAFVMCDKNISGYNGCYVRLVDINDADEKEQAFLSENHRYTASADNFTKIPGSPVAYWVGTAISMAFETGKPIEDFSLPRQGMGTGNNNRFLRLWWEVGHIFIGFDMKTLAEADTSNMKWFPYNKGGEFRKWYGNNEYLVNFQNDGREVKASVMEKYTYLKTPDFVVKNTSYFFQECITWSQVSSGMIAFRYKPAGFITGGGAASIFTSSNSIKYLQGVCNSIVIRIISTLLSPTMNFEINQVKDYPIIEDKDKEKYVAQLVENCIDISRYDWDSYEESWDFKHHPII